MMWLIRFLRGTESVLLFGLFGIGALIVSPLMLVLHRPEFGQPVVRLLWRPLLFLFEAAWLIKVDHSRLKRVKGTVIVANHPSLIDVVMLVSLMPRTLYVAKSALLGNPFMAAIVRATALPDDATLFENAGGYLAKGWNVLVFPEGTRSPLDGSLHPFRRGAAQLALRTGAPIACVRIDFSKRLLAKHESIAEMGEKRVAVTLSSLAEFPVEKTVAGLHSAAIALTERIRSTLSGN